MKITICAECGYEKKHHFKGGWASATFPLPCKQFVEDDQSYLDFGIGVLRYSKTDFYSSIYSPMLPTEIEEQIYAVFMGWA